MELGLSLGDASKPFKFVKDFNSSNQEHKSSKKGSDNLDFSMGLGLNSETEKAQKSEEENDENQSSEDGSDDANQGETETENEGPVVQLSLLPLGPVPRRISSSHLHSLPWSSDNGSSENGSSAARGLDVNKLPASAVGEEVSSANSVGSPFHMDLVVYRNAAAGNGSLQLRGVNNKRGFEADAAVEGGGDRTSSRASDDDENGLNSTRKKLRLSKEQSAFLEDSFKEHNTLNPKQKLALAKQLNLRPRQVEVWFQNRRARTKLKQTEVDCEYLKRWCETLTEENRRLHKELQDLRALKTTNPMYMQLPATTLTMCPSCERVAAAAPPSSSADSSGTVSLRHRFYPFLQQAGEAHHHRHPNQAAPS